MSDTLLPSGILCPAGNTGVPISRLTGVIRAEEVAEKIGTHGAARNNVLDLLRPSGLMGYKRLQSAMAAPPDCPSEGCILFHQSGTPRGAIRTNRPIVELRAMCTQAVFLPGPGCNILTRSNRRRR